MQRVWTYTTIVMLISAVARAQEKPAAKPTGETKPAAASAGALSDPTEILKKADEASKAVNSAKYTAKAKGLGADEPKVPSIEGTVYLEGYKNSRPEKVRYEAKVTPPGSSEVKEVIMGNDGKDYYLIDSSKKIAYVDIDPAVIGSAGRMVTGLTMLEYVHDQPFSDEINAEKKELKESEKVGSEDCYHVYVKYAAQQGQEADWYFSKKDFLPRRVDRKFTPQGGGPAGGRQLIVTSLTADPKLDKDPYKFELPTGYTKSEDFAP